MRGGIGEELAQDKEGTPPLVKYSTITMELKGPGHPKTAIAMQNKNLLSSDCTTLAL